MRSVSVCVLVAICLSCNTGGRHDSSTGKTSDKTSAAKSISVNDVLQAFRAADLPLDEVVIYTEETDPNALLGRPHQYTQKASWDDRRADPTIRKQRLMTVEVFASAEDLEQRRRYVEAITSSASVFAEYQYVHQNALLRLHHALTPKQAREYESALKTL